MSNPPVGGRLALHIKEWESLTNQKWILQTIRGYRIPFHTHPPHAPPPYQRHLTQEQVHIVDQEISHLLEKKAITLSTNKQGFCSRIFPVPKKDGGWRPVLDLSDLNQYVITPHFKMESMINLKDLINPQDYLVKIDLKDAYLTVPIHTESQPYLKFQWKGKTYQCITLPFGLAPAPYVFTKLLRPVLAYFRKRGARMMIYIDDVLVMSHTQVKASQLAQEVVELLQRLGFLINWEKSILSPAQSLEYLGMIVDTVHMELRLPQDKVTKLQKECRNMSTKPTITLRALLRIIGKMTASILAVLEAPLHYRSLQAHANKLRRQGTPLDKQILLSSECKQDLHWWIRSLPVANGRKLKNPLPQVILETDASKSGWGAVSGRNAVSGKWSLEESQLHINLLELRAARLALKTLCKSSQDTHILLKMDNQVAVRYINAKGGTHSHMLNKEAILIWSWCRQQNLTIQAEYLPGALNNRADAESRKKSELSEVESGSVQQNIGNQRTLGNRSVCSETQHSAQEIYQLAARPRGSRNRCFQTRLVDGEGLCISTILPSGKVSEKSDRRQCSKTGPSCSSLASPSVVSPTTGSTHRNSDTPPTVTRLVGGSEGKSTPPSTGGQTSACQLDCVARTLSEKGISDEATQLIQASWRSATQKSYASAWNAWCSWCNRRETDPISAPVKYILDFITDEFKKGKQHSTLNSYRSAISATHVGFSGTPAGQHPLVNRLLQGIFNSRPPMPRNVVFWDVSIVLEHAKSQFPLEELSLNERTAMLLALANADRVSDLHALDLKYRSYRNDGVSFIIPSLTKTRRSGPPREVFYPEFDADRELCPVTSLRMYEQKTSDLRNAECTSLFISLKKPHHPVSSQTISRWIKNFLADSGVDTDQFTAHSTRGVATSSALTSGITLPDIMKAANWKRQSTFSRFYGRPTVDNNFSKAVLSALKVGIL